MRYDVVLALEYLKHIYNNVELYCIINRRSQLWRIIC